VDDATGGDAVIGVVERTRLSSALTEVHRSGQGHNARVLDPTRGDLRGQLRRSGVHVDLGLDPRAKDSVLLLIHSPGRTAKSAELLRRAGASAVHVVDRVGAIAPQPIYPTARSSTQTEGSGPPTASD
jgi:hypothetical protein